MDSQGPSFQVRHPVPCIGSSWMLIKLLSPIVILATDHLLPPERTPLPPNCCSRTASPRTSSTPSCCKSAGSLVGASWGGSRATPNRGVVETRERQIVVYLFTYRPVPELFSGLRAEPSAGLVVMERSSQSVREAQSASK